LTLTAPADWNVSGSSCDNNLPGKLQRIDLLTMLSVTANTRGNWTLNVKDLGLGNTGTLNRWRILLVGST
jgi:subtilisin-like proprotein convertase family protein